MRFSSKLLHSFKELLSLIMHPVTKEELKELMLAPSFQEAFPEFKDGVLTALIAEGTAEMFSAEGIHHDPWGVQDRKDAEKLARKRISDNPKLLAGLQERLPWQASQAQELVTLLRDLRNHFYASDTAKVKQDLLLLQKYHSAENAREKAFAFLLFAEEGTWIDRLPLELFDLAAALYLPRATASLFPAKRWWTLVESRRKSLSSATQMALLDHYLLNGDTAKAQAMLQGLAGDAACLRQAWLDFLLGNTDDAVQKYECLLQTLRTAKQNPEATFTSLPGIFYVFALLKQTQRENARELVASYTANAAIAATALLHSAYADMAAFWRFPADQHTQEATCPLALFFSMLSYAWNGQFSFEDISEIAGEIQNRANPDFPWILRETRNLLAILQGKTADTVNLPDTATVHDCILPPHKWERTLDRLTKLAAVPDEASQYRLIWEVSLENSRDGSVQLRPVEQHASKSRKWSKGHAFAFAHCLSEKNWPLHLEPQDIFLCKLLADPTEAQPTAPGTYRSISALRLLPGHPRLFWEGDARVPCHCEYDMPVLHLTRQDNELNLAITPHTLPNTNMVPVQDNQGTLRIYRFAPQELQIAQELENNPVTLPVSKSDQLLALLPSFAQVFSIFSDIPLLIPGIPVVPADCQLHLRLLPRNKSLTIHLYLLPFSRQSSAYYPCEGPVDCVQFRERHLVCQHRDFEKEREAIQILTAIYPPLQNIPQTEPWTWELPTLEDCCNFTLALQEHAGEMHIHWPENERLRVSRRLTVNDMAVNCRSIGEWLSVDGTVRVDDSLVLSLKDVIRAARGTPGNFIQLEDGQLLALSENFRKRLDDLLAVTSEQEDGNICASNFAAPFLSTLFQQNATLEEQTRRMDEAMNLSPKIPSKLQATLRPYQKEGYIWLSRLYAWKGTGACLADDMGLGKTLQTIALVLAKAAEGPAIVVAPTSVCENWRAEFQKFAPSLAVTIFGGSKREQTLKETCRPNHVLICSYGLLQSEEAQFRDTQWNIAVLDEAQAIKNHHTKRSKAAINLKARFRMVTTGTPIENNLNELWSIFHFITPGLLGKREDFTETFASPIERNADSDMLKRLSCIVKPFILRRRKNQVLPELPQKTEIQLEIEPSAEEKALYEALRQNLVEEIRAQNLAQNQKRFMVIKAITKLRQAACNPRLIQPDSPIESSKLQAFSELLDSLLAAGHRILVFSQFVSHLSIIRKELDERRITYQYLDGSTSVRDRTAAVNAFQNGDGSVFLISLKAGGLGLNLTRADYVIHMDPWWNPAIEDQASDRAHRIGQNNPVTIYRLIAKNTIETRIINLHQQKRELADNILAGTDRVNKISSEELWKLLTNEN